MSLILQQFMNHYTFVNKCQIVIFFPLITCSSKLHMSSNSLDTYVKGVYLHCALFKDESYVM